MRPCPMTTISAWRKEKRARAVSTEKEENFSWFGFVTFLCAASVTSLARCSAAGASPTGSLKPLMSTRSERAQRYGVDCGEGLEWPAGCRPNRSPLSPIHTLYRRRSLHRIDAALTRTTGGYRAGSMQSRWS